MEKQCHVHKDHRKRLRIKIEKSGLKSLANHEILEYILTLVIPRKDTNPIAHNLINTFGGLSNVFKAKKQDLKLVKGVGENTALYLNSISELMDILKEHENKSKQYKLLSTQDCVKFFRENFVVTNTEEFFITCLRKNFSVIKTVKLESYDSNIINIDTREIMHLITSKEVNNIVIFHTHPFGEIEPSEEDDASTKRILEICKTVGINIVDHIIFNETSHFTYFCSTNLLDNQTT